MGTTIEDTVEAVSSSLTQVELAPEQTHNRESLRAVLAWNAWNQGPTIYFMSS